MMKKKMARALKKVVIQPVFLGFCSWVMVCIRIFAEKTILSLLVAVKGSGSVRSSR